MSREKQINKMAKELCHAQQCHIKDEPTECYHGCKAYIYAERAYDKDYRKQSEGEWIFEHEFYGKMLCSNCKEEALTNEDNEYVDSDFCPNCGAKMKGGAE